MKLVAENNSMEIFEEAQNLVANEEGLMYGEEEEEDEEVDSESEYETTDDETDDEDQDRCGYSCPFCLEVFHTRETAQRHTELYHGDETEGEM